METSITNAPLSIRATIKEAWHLVHGTKLPILLTSLFMFFVGLVTFIILGAFNLDNSSNHYLALSYAILSPFIHDLALLGFFAGLLMIGLKRARHQTVGYFDGLKYFRKLPKLAFMGYIIDLIVFIPLAIVMLGIVLIMAKLNLHSPVLVKLSFIGLMFLILSIECLFVFSFQLALDKNYSLLASLGRSVKLVRPHFWKIFVLVLILSIINLLGACLAGIGLIWSMPLFFNAIGIVYREVVDKGL